MSYDFAQVCHNLAFLMSWCSAVMIYEAFQYIGIVRVLVMMKQSNFGSRVRRTVAIAVHNWLRSFLISSRESMSRFIHFAFVWCRLAWSQINRPQERKMRPLSASTSWLVWHLSILYDSISCPCTSLVHGPRPHLSMNVYSMLSCRNSDTFIIVSPTLASLHLSFVSAVRPCRSHHLRWNGYHRDRFSLTLWQ